MRVRVGDSSFFDPCLIHRTLENVHIIRNHLKVTYRKKKSYVYHRITILEFKEGDKVYIKISFMKGGVIFVKT